MKFNELLSHLEKIRRVETRSQAEDFFEIVISKDEEAVLIQTLEGYFGHAFKPKDQRPTRDADHYAKPYGGIQANQTLYLRNPGIYPDLALLWPWGNGERITVKVISSSKAVRPDPGSSWFSRILGFVKR